MWDEYLLGDDLLVAPVWQAGAREPALLARQLTLLLDGGLAGGVLDGDPTIAEAARRSARILVDAALG